MISTSVKQFQNFTHLGEYIPCSPTSPLFKIITFFSNSSSSRVRLSHYYLKALNGHQGATKKWESISHDPPQPQHAADLSSRFHEHISFPGIIASILSSAFRERKCEKPIIKSSQMDYNDMVTEHNAVRLTLGGC